MEKYFTIISCDELSLEVVENVVLDLVGANSRINKINTNTIAIYHNFSKTPEIEATILGLIDELMTDISCYNSSLVFSNKINEEEAVAIKLINTLPAGSYDLKSAVVVADKIENKNQILEFILEGSGIDFEFIKEFVKYDLNVSKASKAMYIHRNTMLYKLDKLNEVSNFDLRSFKDAYILYYLCEKR